MAEELARRGHDVLGLAHEQICKPIGGAREIVAADLTDSETVTAALDAIRPDHVIHLAAIAFVAHGDVEQMYRTNILGARNVLEALAALPHRPRSILLASSANVYGNRREGKLDESMPASPANDYGVSKLAMEAMAGLYSERLPLIVTRPFNYTGVGQSAEFLIPKIVNHARERAPVIELGNLDVARDFSDVRMVVDAYARLLDSPEAVGRTVNVCSGHPVTLREIMERVSRLSGHEMQVAVNPDFVRVNEVRTLSGSPALLEQLIGQPNRIELDDTLRWMLEA